MEIKDEKYLFALEIFGINIKIQNTVFLENLFKIYLHKGFRYAVGCWQY